MFIFCRGDLCLAIKQNQEQEINIGATSQRKNESKLAEGFLCSYASAYGFIGPGRSLSLSSPPGTPSHRVKTSSLPTASAILAHFQAIIKVVTCCKKGTYDLAFSQLLIWCETI